MKSKKNKENTTPPRTLEKDSNHRNAFSFLKNRFFSGNNNNSNSSNNTIVNHNNSSNSTLHEKLSSPRPSISSIRSVVTKPWSIETKNETITDKPLSRSFDDNSSTDITTTYHRNRTNARPLSMMGIDSLSTELPATIHIAKPSVVPDTLSKDNDEAEKRTSLTIAKEGYLFKKSDFKPFHKQSKLDRGWKLYRVVLRGHKLYLYKLTTESPLRSLFPSAPYNKLQHSNQSIASLHSLSSSSIVSNNNMKLVRSDFDREAQQVLFSSATTTTIPQGCVFMELNQSTLLAKQEVYLILLDDMIYICIRPDLGQLWKIENKVSAQNLRIETSDSIPPTSPASISSMQSDPFSYSLLFSLINLNLPSAPLGVYSTQHRELGQAWINAFQSLHQLQEDEILSASSNQISGRMYNATQEDRHNLIYRNHRSDEIQGGTIHALVRQLFSEYATTITPTSSSSYLNVFLLTYSIFTSGANVLNEIKLILKEEREEKDRVLFQLRVLDIFTIWCQQFALDVMGDVATGMIDILENCMDNAASQVKELVLKTLAENTKRTCEQVIVTTMTTTQPLGREEDEEDKEQNKNEVENISAYEVDGKRRDSINLSNLLITGLTQDVFLEMDPMSFAQQIYLFHLLKYKQFRDELLNPLSYLPRPQTSVQMLNSLLFTTSSPHFLTKLIRNQVLIDSQSSNNNKYGISMRSRLLEHWIRIGLSLLQLGDMTGWCAVAMGVCSVGIVRLHETWKGVSRELVYHVQTDWVRLLSDFGLFTQDVWNETWGEPPMLTQFSKVLDMHDIAAAHDVSPSLAEMYIPEGSLPFFGTIRQSVDRFRKHTKKLLSPTIVNFIECQYIHEMIVSSLDEWKNENRLLDENVKISIPIVSPLQTFFEHSVTDFMSVPHSYKYLQECSLACEPKVFGQMHDCKKFSSRSRQASNLADIAPPSMSCLAFPTILNRSSLLSIENASTKKKASASNSNISQLSSQTNSTQTLKKTHPRKTANNSSIRSIRSILDDDRGQHLNNKKQSNSNSHVSTSQSSSSLNLVNTPASDNQSDVLTNNHRKALRRRTYSFPPGSGVPDGSTQTVSKAPATSTRYDLLESDSNRTWLGSLLSNRSHRTYSTRALIEAHRKSRTAQYDTNGDIILSVQDGNLIFKASAVLKHDSTLSGTQELEKTETNHLVDFLKKGEEEQGLSNEETLIVSIKAGSLEKLVDTLVYGVSIHEETLKDQWQMILLAGGLENQQYRLGKVIMDEEEFTHVFFMTFRTYCSSNELLDLFRKRFLEIKQRCKSSLKRKNSLSLLETYFTPNVDENAKQQNKSKSEQILMYDWKKVAKTQLRVLNLLLYWAQTYPYDFADEIEVTHYMSQFLRQARKSLEEWSIPLAKYHGDESVKQEHADALKTAAMIKQRIIDLREKFVGKSLCPCYDMKTVDFDPEVARGLETLYGQLAQNKSHHHVTLQLATNNSVPISISTRPRDTDAKSPLDRFAPDVLLEQIDRDVRQLFNAVTTQEWIQTFDVLEAQLEDIYAWLPARKPSRTSRLTAALTPVLNSPTSFLSSYHVLSDEVIVSDIFTAIEGARRSVVSPSAFTDDDLLLALPGSVQYLYYMHFIIRSWVINEIVATTIDFKARVMRIEKFLQIIVLSRTMSQKMSLSPDIPGGMGQMPGFVEYAIASALVSPEVRLFTKVWNDIAIHHGHANLDTLESLLNQIQMIQSIMPTSPSYRSFNSESSLSRSASVVPCVGWVFERIVELCVNVPDTFESKHMIHFDKRRSLHQFMQSIMTIQRDLHNQPLETKGFSMSFLISPNNTQESWRDLKEYAMRENKKPSAANSLVLRGTSNKTYTRHMVFNKLVIEQLDKLKREFKERDRIDKDWLTLQHKLQKKQLEQARLVEKQDRKASHGKSLSASQPHYNGVMPRLNSFFRGLRPQSMVATSAQGHAFVDSHAATKASTVINLIHATTSVASTYTKRDFVFRIVTEEGGQYLLQAIHREDMYDWMQQINNASREGAAKRQSVLAADSLESDSHEAFLIGSNRKEPASRNSVYGVQLEILMRDKDMIPIVVEKCIREIERRGLEEVGIYRVAGTGSVVSALKAEFNKNADAVDLNRPEWADINVIADAFKQFLRELPEPLLTYTYYDEFIKASASEDHDERVYLLKKVLKKLPNCNYTLLKRIIEHFVIVTDFEATNHMYATNLAIVFGPTLLQPAPGPASFATTMSNLGHHQNIVKYLILNYHYLFDVESEEVIVEPSLSTSSSSKADEKQTHDEL